MSESQDRMRPVVKRVDGVMPEPVPARSIRPHDHVVGAGTVRWVMSPMQPQSHPLLPYGGVLLTFVNDTQMGVLADVELMVYRLGEATLDGGAIPTTPAGRGPRVV